MTGMFCDTENFNQAISMWNTRHVNDMSYMFAGSKKFNQPLHKWNISNLSNKKDFAIDSILDKRNYPLF